MTEQTRAYWDAEAERFDAEADHGLVDPVVRRAWLDRLIADLPAAPADVVDLGCGTGSLAVLLAESGFGVRGLDLSPAMVAAATAKAASAGVAVPFVQGDASVPPYEAASCDVVLARHVLWALPDPDAALERWTCLLRPGGRLVLVEGNWSTGAGLTATRCEALVRRHRRHADVLQLTDPRLWGGPVDDERYRLLSVG